MYLQNIQHALRVLRKTPWVTATALLAIALGIGANTAIFSVVNGVLLRPLPYPDSDELAMIWMDNTRLKLDQDWHSYPNYAYYKSQSKSFRQMAGFNTSEVNLTGDGEPVRVPGAIASWDLFPLLGVRPVLGRTFTQEEDTMGRHFVTVISHGLWQRRFGGSPSIVGRNILINGTARVIVGVMPPGFDFPTPETQIWTPLAPSPELMEARGSIWMQAIGRLRGHVTLETARAEMAGLAGQLEREYPDFNEGYGVNLVRLHDQIVGPVRPAVLVLLGAVTFLLLIACTNVANLLLARASAREREMAIRTALGASRPALLRQVLTESVILSLVGGALGVALAYLGLGFILAMGPEDIPRLAEIAIDGRVLVFTAVLSVLTGLLFGLLPAIRTSQQQPSDRLKEGMHYASSGMRGRRFRSGLIVTEIALSLMLLIGAGLMIRSFVELQRTNLGFQADRLLTFRLQPSGESYRTAPAIRSFYSQLLDRLRTVPGIESAAAVSTLFLSATPNSGNFSIEGRPDPPVAERIEVTFDSVTPGYFNSMQIPLMAGREFTEADGPESPQVVLINQTMADVFWPGESPVGRRFKYGTSNSNSPWMTIAGVVSDTRRNGFDRPPRAETYRPHSQRSTGGMTVVARTAMDPLLLASTVRSEVRTIDPNLPVFAMRSMDDVLGGMMAQRRMNMILLSAFAAIAGGLAAVGLYGVMAYTVAQRSREIGVRVALGARRVDVLRMVIGDGFVLCTAGIVSGLIASAVLTRLMSSMLYNVSTTDTLTFAITPALLLIVALGACYFPAIRATRVDPIITLRDE